MCIVVSHITACKHSIKILPSWLLNLFLLATTVQYSTILTSKSLILGIYLYFCPDIVFLMWNECLQTLTSSSTFVWMKWVAEADLCSDIFSILIFPIILSLPGYSPRLLCQRSCKHELSVNEVDCLRLSLGLARNHLAGNPDRCVCCVLLCCCELLRLCGGGMNPAAVPTPLEDVQGDGRWLSMVSTEAVCGIGSMGHSWCFVDLTPADKKVLY